MRKGNKENIKKEFTIRERKDIINEEHNLLNKDENFYEREGLFMYNDKVLAEAKKISKKYNKKEKVILEMFEIGENNGYSVDEIKTMIEEFENNDNCY